MTAEVDRLVNSTLKALVKVLETPNEQKSLQKLIFDAYSSSFTSIDVKHHSQLFRKLSLYVHSDKLNNPNDDNLDMSTLKILLIQRELPLDTLQTVLANFQPGKSNIVEQLVSNPNTGFQNLYQRLKAALYPMLFAYKRYYSPFNGLVNLISWVINIGLFISAYPLKTLFQITNFLNEILNKIVRAVINSISNNAVDAAVDIHINKQYVQGEKNYWNNARFAAIEVARFQARIHRWSAKKCTPNLPDESVLIIYNSIKKEHVSQTYRSQMRSHMEDLAKQTDDEIDSSIKKQFDQLSNKQLKEAVALALYNKKLAARQSASLDEENADQDKRIENDIRLSLKPVGLTIIAITFKAMGSVILDSQRSIFRRALNLIAIIPAILITSGLELIRYALTLARLVPFISLFTIKAASLAVLNSPLYVLDAVRYLAKCMCFPGGDAPKVVNEGAVGVSPSLSGLRGKPKESEEQKQFRQEEVGHFASPIITQVPSSRPTEGQSAAPGPSPGSLVDALGLNKNWFNLRVC